jgi:hypothetical protein
MKSFKKSLVTFSFYPSLPILTSIRSFVAKILILQKINQINSLHCQYPPPLLLLHYPPSPPLLSNLPSQIAPDTMEAITPFLYNYLPNLLALPFKPLLPSTVDWLLIEPLPPRPSLLSARTIPTSPHGPVVVMALRSAYLLALNQEGPPLPLEPAP